ncbi:hypothetical protein [Leptolyngbya ohadii]|uniref:hypothetical protein n=1 Tax=Leptolyngbya ohadii TaxID=1962290 RepID=UPI001179C164|nr:hypothetical protein [Leptolyngbya ohadii]
MAAPTLINSFLAILPVDQTFRQNFPKTFLSGLYWAYVGLALGLNSGNCSENSCAAEITDLSYLMMFP